MMRGRSYFCYFFSSETAYVGAKNQLMSNRFRVVFNLNVTRNVNHYEYDLCLLVTPHKHA